MMTVWAPSTEDMKAAFTKVVFTKIDVGPMYTALTQLKTEAIQNAASIKYRAPVPHKNLCGPIKQAHNYMLCVGRPFSNCLYPGDTPKFPDRYGVLERKEVQAYYDMNMRLYLTT